jgi:hypothetical protein
MNGVNRADESARSVQEAVRTASGASDSRDRGFSLRVGKMRASLCEHLDMAALGA